MNPASVQRLLSAELALALASAAQAAARAEKLAVAVAVVDAAGQLKAFLADDGAPWVATELSQRKARTALLGISTADLGTAIHTDAAMLASFGSTPGITLLGGGVPVRADGQLLGGLGIGGGTPEQDARLAAAAIAAIGLK